MAELASFTLKKRNPDVLTCIANLSNDEVFTPPEFAKQILDTLEIAWSDANNGASIWADSKVKFLDPCTKSGVFLREIVERLTKGLESEIPDLRTRVNHILTKQIFGIGITHLTSLLARRSVYCSKFANGEHSVASSFENADGNIWFESIKHTWVGGTQGVETADELGNPVQKKINGRCKYCGASQSSLERSLELETHAYSFIHTEEIQKFIAEIYGEEMQFDVIIGNPPYQLNDGGGSGTSAAPIYQKFVEQAKKLEPRLLTMVIPSRWFSGGKGLDSFRSEMLEDARIRRIDDFPESNDVFPGTQIKGGVCFFLWDRDHQGDCEVVTHHMNLSSQGIFRPLLEPGSDVFIRFNQAISVLRKVSQQETGSHSESLELPQEQQFSRIVSSRRPFGDIEKHVSPRLTKGIEVHLVGGKGWASKKDISTGIELLDCWKVYIPFLASGSDAFPHPILGRPFLGRPGTATSETNLVIGPLASEDEAKNVMSYISTRFFRFLVLQRKPSQNATRKVYGFVPMQDFSQKWTDEKLFKKYKLEQEEIEFIESMIRPMELESE
jgi:hypothetical protein